MYNVALWHSQVTTVATGTQCMYNVAPWHSHVTTVATGTQCMYNVALWQSSNHCCYRNTMICSVCTVVDLHSAVNKKKTIKLCHGNARWVLLPPPPNNKICCTAFNHTNVPWYLCKVPWYLCKVPWYLCKVPWYLCKVPSTVVQFHPNLEFLNRFS